MANIDKELAKIKAANWGGDLRTSMADALVKVNEERSGTLDYEDLNNKPQINSVELTGNNTLQQIGAAPASDITSLGTRMGQAESDIDSLESQFNTVVSAVTTDTEVTNIRVGADGTTYATAGEAVRSQVSDLKSALKDITGNEIVHFTKGYGINTSGTTVDINTPVASVLLDYIVISCSGGDVFTLSGKGGENAYVLYVFADSSGNILYKSSANLILEFGVIEAPANSSYLIVNAYTQYVHSLYRGITIKEAMSDIESELSDIKNTFEKTVVHTPVSSYSNALATPDYVWILDYMISAKSIAKLSLYGKSGILGSTDVYFFKKNSNGTYTSLTKISFDKLIGENIVNIPESVKGVDYYIGFYSQSSGIGYNSTKNLNRYRRVQISDISLDEIPEYGSPINLDFNFALTVYSGHKAGANGFVVVDASGEGDYTSLLDAMTSEPEGTVIVVKPGVYNQDMTSCLLKRVIVIGTDRNQCIIRDTDGRGLHHPLYVSCGYFENLTIFSEYVSGTSQEVGLDYASYAVHIDTDNDYAVGKAIEFHHCTIKSDFFPAVGIGLRKDATFIFDDCELVNNQIVGRGDYSDEGSLGALYFHDSNGEQGNQYIKVKGCVLKSKLKYAMCPYQISRDTQNNRVYCDFINNVLYSDVGQYTDTVWFRGNPFDESTGIFSIGIGYGNSIDSLNN